MLGKLRFLGAEHVMAARHEGWRVDGVRFGRRCGSKTWIGGDRTFTAVAAVIWVTSKTGVSSRRAGSSGCDWPPEIVRGCSNHQVPGGQREHSGGSYQQGMSGKRRPQATAEHVLRGGRWPRQGYRGDAPGYNSAPGSAGSPACAATRGRTSGAGG